MVGPALADLSLAQMQKASGLAEILTKAKPCGYEVNDAALESYYLNNGLATPEALSFISNTLSLAELDDTPTASDCTMARTTAKAIGLLK